MYIYCVYFQNAEGVQIAFFKPSVDKLSFLRSTKEEEDGLMDVIGAGKPQVLTLVAFLGYSNFVRSEARTIRSTDASFTGGTGRASSLTLILRLGASRKEKFLSICFTYSCASHVI